MPKDESYWEPKEVVAALDKAFPSVEPEPVTYKLWVAKEKYLKAIAERHPVYTPGSAIAQKAIASMRQLPEQTLFYLYHLTTKREGGK